jgi:hypothetical protein
VAVLEFQGLIATSSLQRAKPINDVEVVMIVCVKMPEGTDELTELGQLIEFD